MWLLYQIGIRFLVAGIQISAYFNSKARASIRGRRDWKEKMKRLPDKVNNQTRYWFHCSSLGEFEQAVPVMEGLKQNKTNQIIVTFFSPSGYEKRHKHPLADAVLYLPFDTPSNAKYFVQQLNADCACFVKYEFWLNTLSACFEQNLPVFLISAVFRKNQIFFKEYGGIFRRTLARFTFIFTQEKNSVSLLNEIGIYNANFTGDTRFDRVFSNARNLTIPQELLNYSASSPVLVVGSSWPQEEEMILRGLPFLSKKYNIIIAPHDIKESRIQKILENFKGHEIERFSELNGRPAKAKLLILDTIGNLTAVYKIAHIALIGGGFNNALHNILEPLAFGVPVFFGPDTEKYPEAAASIAASAAFPISNLNDLKTALATMEDHYVAYAQNAASFIESGTGGTKTILEHLKKDRFH
jgi:3-deoxy-D-manno-octulosonic-acid transferase